METKKLALIGLFVALMAVSAHLRIDLGFMPLTFQTGVAALAAMLLTPRQAFTAMAAYLALGLAGAPVFAMGGGIGYALSPTFGYLLGFLFGAPMGAQYLNRVIPEEFAQMRPKGLRARLSASDTDEPGIAPISSPNRFSLGQCILAGLVVVMCVFVCGVLYSWFYYRHIAGTPEPFGNLMTTTMAFLWIKDSVLVVVVAGIATQLRKHLSL